MATKIVIAEDDEILAKVIVEELKEAGFDVTHAKNGVEAVSEIQSKMPNLVLCDVLMPEKDGFGVLEETKKNPATKNIPFIMLTMLGSDDDIKKGLKMGANDYIVKSQHAVAEIVEKVKEFFGKESHPEANQGEATAPAPEGEQNPQ
jgi:DNA-binding response OmpR family regulator